MQEAGNRAALCIVAAALAVLFAGSTLLTPMYELYRRAFGLSQLTTTLIYATYAAGNIVALLLVGRASDLIGRRRTALPSLTVAALSSTCYLLAPRAGSAWLFVGRAMSGLAVGIAAGTATAWIADLTPGDRSRASIVTVVANYVGIAAGPLVAGLLVQYGPARLRLVHWIYLGSLIATAIALTFVPETVRAARNPREVSWRPRIGVPREIRAGFLSPAATVFSAFALVGFYAALAPTVLKRDLHQPNLAAGGLTVAAMFASGAGAVWLTRSVPSRRAALGGLTALLVALALLVAAESVGSMVVLLSGAVIGGVAAATCYRGSLQVVNQLAPGDRRAEVISSYLLVGFLGNALPVIGVGVLARLAPPRLADVCFSAAIALLTLMALVTGMKLPPRDVQRAA